MRKNSGGLLEWERATDVPSVADVLVQFGSTASSVRLSFRAPSLRPPGAGEDQIARVLLTASGSKVSSHDRAVASLIAGDHRCSRVIVSAVSKSSAILMDSQDGSALRVSVLQFCTGSHTSTPLSLWRL